MKEGKLVIVELISALACRRGAETFFYDLAFELERREDVELHVVVLYDDIDPSFEPLRDRLGPRFQTLGKHSGMDVKASLRLRKAIRAIRPNVVHGHLAYLPTYWLAFGRRKQPFRLVHTCHNIHEPYDKWKRHFAKKDRVVFAAISPHVAQTTKILCPRANIQVVYNGVNLPEIKVSKESSVYDFVCVAAFSQQKNHRLLMDALALLQKELPSVFLLCLGEGPLLEETKEYAKEIGVFNSVSFLGSKPNVYDYLVQSKVFVLSSKFEGTPVSILEAMNAGLPIVAPNVGGVADLVTDGVNGFLASPEDPVSLFECMKRALATYPENKIGQQNKLDVQQFGVGQCVDEYLRLFRTITALKNEK